MTAKNVSVAEAATALIWADESTFDSLAKRIAEADLSKSARAKCERELAKLQLLGTQAPTAAKSLAQIETALEHPLTAPTPAETELKRIHDKLNKSSFGLQGIKDRVIEDIALQMNTGKPTGTVFALIGAPGTGKKTLINGVAAATGREVVTIDLTAVTHASEIRGWAGAEMGKIYKAWHERASKANNPIIVLEGIDKMGGDAGVSVELVSALLEAIAPEKNRRFIDRNTGGVGIDLSNAMFFVTANDRRRIPALLLERMVPASFTGYKDEQKLSLAKEVLIPKQLEKHGLTAAQFAITDEALEQIIELHTGGEPGVHYLDKLIGGFARQVLVQIGEGKLTSTVITPETLGPRPVYKQVNKEPRVGHVNGLAVSGGTSGSVLPIEAAMFADPKGGVEATGNLMQTIAESVEYADAYVKSHANELGITQDKYLNNTIHIKVNRGGVGADGPSAGLAIATLITSVRTGIAIRGDVAMTGEISVLGESGAIGGLAQKLDGAFKAGIRTVLIPEANMRDLAMVPKKLMQNLQIIKPGVSADKLPPVPEGKMRIIPVRNISEVLDHALVSKPVPLTAEQIVKQGAAKLDPAQALALLAQVFAAAAAAPVPAQAPANGNVPQQSTGRHAAKSLVA